MALDEKYIPLTLLNEYFVDKDTGLPLAAGTLSFFRDTARATPKTVYELVSTGGAYTYVPLPNPVVLSSVGTAMNSGGDNVAIYAYPFMNDPSTSDLTLDLYYIVCEDSDGNEQWTREAVPSITSANDPVGGTNNNLNQLANPQFSQYFLIDDTVTLTLSGSTLTFPIAPDWDFVASGTGTVLLERVPTAGNEAIPTYPAYYISLTIGAGVTAPFLRQRLSKNSGLWSGQFVAGFFAGKVGVGSNSVTMKYKDAAGTTSDVTIFTAALTQDWSTYGGSTQIDDSSDTLSGDDAYVDIVIELPTANTIDITSLQIQIGNEEFQVVETYDSRSANREQAFMGDYYIPWLNYKNVPSLVYCWDFPKNPRQFGASGTQGAATAAYIWDQTILQTVGGLSVDYSENVKTNGLSLNHTNADKSYALIQYLDQEDAAKFVGTPLSVNINGYTTDGGNSAEPTTVYVKMFAVDDATVFGTLPTTIVTIGASDGTITLTAQAVIDGWYEIARNNLPTAKGVLQVLDADGDISSVKDLSFNNWAIETDAQVTAGVQGVAVVVSFVPTASTTDYETQIDSISVVPGNIACRPAPQSEAQTIIDAQRYYEKSYEGSTITTYNNAVHSWQLGDDAAGTQTVAATFQLNFNTYKRAAPTTMTFYSPTTGTADRVRAFHAGYAGTPTIGSADATFSTNWTTDNISNRRVSYNRLTNASLATSASGADAGQGWIAYHFTADSRIGK